MLRPLLCGVLRPLLCGVLATAAGHSTFDVDSEEMTVPITLGSGRSNTMDFAIELDQVSVTR